MKRPKIVKKYKIEFVTSSTNIEKTLEKLYTHFGIHSGTLKSTEVENIEN